MAVWRLWYEPDGQVKITSFPDVGMVESAAAILIADGRVDTAATFDDVDSQDALDAKLPADRVNRAKWRYKGPVLGIIVDATVPDPPDPDQDLVDTITAVSSMAEAKQALKAVLKRVRGR